MANFTDNFWRGLGSLGIYSTEADDESPTLADQMDAGVPGGANASDTAEEVPAGDGLDMDMGTDDMGGMDDMSGGDATGDMSGGADMSAGGDMGAAAPAPTNPNENPFKGPNGKALLDNKLAELQTAVSDTLERVYANPSLEHVVVSELENLLDSIRNIRETVFIVPVDATLYKYQLSTLSYKQLAESVVAGLKNK